MNKIKQQLVDIDAITKQLVEDTAYLKFDYEHELEAYVSKIKDRLDAITEKMTRIDETSTTIAYLYEQLTGAREQVSKIIDYMDANLIESGQPEDVAQSKLLHNSYKDLTDSFSTLDEVIVYLN